MMIENHFSLNIAYKGDHYARVELYKPQEIALRTARQIAEALRIAYGQPANWSFALVHVECSSRAIEGGGAI